MKKILAPGLILCSALAPATALAVQAFDARSMGRAGAGLTMGEFNQALKNPALVNRRSEADRFSANLGLGIIASDKDGLIDDVDDIEDELDKLDQCQFGFIGNCPDSDNIADAMERMDGKKLTLDGGAAALIGIPSATLPMAATLRSKARIGGMFVYNEDDREELNKADDGNPLTRFNEENLKSTIDASAMELRELGLMAGQTLSLDGLPSVDLGATLKLQKITLVHDSQRIGSIDYSDILDEDNKKEHNGVNIDLGATTRLGDSNEFILAATVENLLPRSFSGPSDTEFRLYPVTTVAGGYQAGPVSAEAGLELNKRHGFGLMEATQFAYAGAELAAGQHAQLRFGYRTDIQNNVADVVSLGFGLSPFNAVNLDLALMIGEGDTFGAAVEIGMRF